jgi:sialic acid synthase SpsE
VIEKHITLDKKAGGLDDPVALTPEAFAAMTAAVKRFALPALASPRDAGSADPPSPVPAAAPSPAHLSAVIGELAGEYGRERVEACLGDGIKGLAPAEESSYTRTNRTLHARGALKKGTIISEENTAFLRTEKVLNPGLEPRYRKEAYGRRLNRDIPPGDGITLEDLQPPGCPFSPIRL